MKAVDLDELKRISELALSEDWRIVRFYMSGSKIGIDAGERGVCCSYDRWREDEFRFIAAANPAVVLELIRRVRSAEGAASADLADKNSIPEREELSDG